MQMKMKMKMEGLYNRIRKLGGFYKVFDSYMVLLKK